jgi:hypothetical protein
MPEEQKMKGLIYSLFEPCSYATKLGNYATGFSFRCEKDKKFCEGKGRLYYITETKKYICLAGKAEMADKRYGDPLLWQI